MVPPQLLLLYALWLILTFFFSLSMVTFIKNRGIFHAQRPEISEKPPVAIIVPAYNEEANIANTIESVLSINYPRDCFEVVIINDGSKDGTGEICRKYAGEGLITYLENNPNIGKAASLNRGIEYADTEYVICIDADTVIEKDIIQKTLPYFDSDDVAAVTSAIKVKNPKTWMQKIIEVEYAVGNGFYNKIWSLLNCMFVTPGQFSIYRREKVLEVGGFDRNNLVEDMELAYRMNKAGMKIAVCTSATAHTVVPATVKDFYYQRKRWYTGTIQTILKHRDVVFNPGLGSFGTYFVPFNYGGTVLAIMLSISFLWIILSSLSISLSNLGLIGFDILSQMKMMVRYAEWDPFNASIYQMLGLSPLLMNFIVTYVALKSMGHRVRDNLLGYFGFIFFFIPYQIIWGLSMYFVAFKREVKWRAGM